MTELILRIITAGGYWGIAALMALENIFPPVPSEVIMGFGGIAVAHGEMAFWPLLLAGTIGSVIGNYCWYLAGRRLGYLRRSEEHTPELQSLMRTSYAVFCLQKKIQLYYSPLTLQSST